MESYISLDVDKKEIKDFIKEAEQGIYFLPSFQRQYVWDEDDIKGVINSILDGLPIGTVIL